MTRFANHPLFDAGLDSVRVGPLRARQAINAGPSGHGAAATNQGIEPREIHHRGRIVADSNDALTARIAAIEAWIDAGPQTLSLTDGRSYPRCLMTQAEFEPAVAVGPRLATRFTVKYLQLTPGDEVNG